MTLFSVHPSIRFFLTSAVVSALVLSSCSQSLTQSSMLGKESKPVAPTPEKIVASPVPGLYEDDEQADENTEVTPTPSPVSPRGPFPYTPTPTPTTPTTNPTTPTPTWHPWNSFKFPPVYPPKAKPEPKLEPKLEPKTEPKVEPKVPPTVGPVRPPLLPPPAPTNPKWDPPNLFKLSQPTPPRAEPKKEELNRYDFLKIMTRTYDQAIGFYDRGSLTRADLLPNAGDGYLKIFQERQRGFGSLDLVTLIIEASREIRRDFPAVERVQIGDISDKNGGRLRGHGSHQNGLDADIAYFRKDRVEISATGSKGGTTGFGAGFVQKGRVLPTFDTEANWRFIRMMDETGRLDRIFIDQRIKKEFCKLAVAKGMRDDWKDTLRKLRHWRNHADHMHVRITCPKNSKGCKPTPAIPAGDGCDSLLGRGRIVRTSGGFYLNAEDQRRHEAMGEELLDGPEPALEEHGC